ncbi:MAG: DUF721 domain-containing protein [Prevotella sp.]|nr:DUF721 domain-containing protein [Prevotella sp.]
MFKRDVKQFDNLLSQYLRTMGLETPLLKRRLISAWPEVMDDVVVKNTGRIFVSNQTLNVEINNSALRAELLMRRNDIVERLNNYVGVRVVVDVMFF